MQRLWIGLVSVLVAACDYQAATLSDAGVDDGAVDSSGLPPQPRTSWMPTPRQTPPTGIVNGWRPLAPRAVQVLREVAARARSMHFAPDGSVVALDRQGRLHTIASDGRRWIKPLGRNARHADGLLADGQTLIWYRTTAHRRGHYFADLWLHISEDRGTTWRRQRVDLAVGNGGGVIRLERKRITIHSGAEFRCGGGAYFRIDGQVGLDPARWTREDGVDGDPAFSAAGPRLRYR